ncbi:MAG: hypothetical protein DSY77_15205, partial [Bacteroidetes bacterium]
MEIKDYHRLDRKYRYKVLTRGKYGLYGLEIDKLLDLKEAFKFLYDIAYERSLAVLNSNPDYPYPDQYKNGKELDYWLEHTNHPRELSIVLKVINKRLNELIEAEEKKETIPPPPQPDKKDKPDPAIITIAFNSHETIEKLHAELKGYFPNKENELLKVLEGKELNE